jgi:hypothetical protein
MTTEVFQSTELQFTSEKYNVGCQEQLAKQIILMYAVSCVLDKTDFHSNLPFQCIF